MASVRFSLRGRWWPSERCHRMLASWASCSGIDSFGLSSMTAGKIFFRLLFRRENYEREISKISKARTDNCDVCTILLCKSSGGCGCLQSKIQINSWDSVWEILSAGEGDIQTDGEEGEGHPLTHSQEKFFWLTWGYIKNEREGEPVLFLQIGRDSYQ